MEPPVPFDRYVIINTLEASPEALDNSGNKRVALTVTIQKRSIRILAISKLGLISSNQTYP